MSRYLRPRLVAMHLFVLLVVVVCLNAGWWQLGRLDERRVRNELVEDRMALTAEPVGDLVDPDSPEGVVEELRFRPVTAEGDEYVPGVRVRTNQDGVSGAWVFDLLPLDGGEQAWVLRGFTRLDGDGEIPEPPYAVGPLAVEGLAIPIERLPRTSRTAIAGFEGDTGGVLPVAVQASTPDPPLTPVPTPELGEGPHLGYAVQWFLFAAVAVVGYPFLLRRRMRDDRASASASAEEEGGGG